MISVIIPAYNSADTLQQSYESIINGGVKAQEIIFVDDGSTDDTRQIISNIQADNSSVIFLENNLNLGGGATRNKGVQLAKNPLVFILDSDDILVPGALQGAIDQLNSSGVDGVATSRSVFFSSSIEEPKRIIEYKSGMACFEDLVSHIPSPVIGNLLFTKQAYIEVGGYPTHHSFDTQGFGFRLLQNNKKILVGDNFLYYQRVPLKPSYYAREARAGNVNRNWFYIFHECLYKFSLEVRKQILNFSYSDASVLAKGDHLFNALADQSSGPDFYCKEMEGLDDRGAYNISANSDDYTLNAWCLMYEIKNHHYDLAFARLHRMERSSNEIRLIYPLIAELFGSKLSDADIEELSYFFSKKKSLGWRARTLKQKIYNRLAVSRYL